MAHPPLSTPRALAYLGFCLGLLLLATLPLVPLLPPPDQGVLGIFAVPKAMRPDGLALSPLTLDRTALRPGLLEIHRRGDDLEGRTIRPPSVVPAIVWDGPSSLPPRVKPPFLHEWQGYLEITSPGIYRFRVGSRRGVFLLLNGEQVVGCTPHGLKGEVYRDQRLEKGLYALQLILRDQQGKAWIKVDWQPPGQTWQPLPTSQLFHAPPDDQALTNAWRQQTSPPRPDSLPPAAGSVNLLSMQHFSSIAFSAARRSVAFNRPYYASWGQLPRPFPQHIYQDEVFFRGLYRLPKAVTQRLEVRGPGSAQLFLDDRPLLFNPTQPQRTSDWIRLEAGDHPLLLSFRSPLIGSNLELRVQRLNHRSELLPADQLYLRPEDRHHAPGAWLPRGLPALVGGLLSLLCALLLSPSRPTFLELRHALHRFRLPLGLALLLILAAGLRLYQWDQIPRPAETMDELANAWNGWHLWQGQGPSTWADERFLHVYPQKVRYTWLDNPFSLVKPYVDRPPLYAFVLGLTLQAWHLETPFHVTLPALRILPICLSLLTLLVTVGLGRRLYGEAVGWLAGLIYACSPLLVWSARLGKEESLVALLWGLGFYASLRGVGHRALGDAPTQVKNDLKSDIYHATADTHLAPQQPPAPGPSSPGAQAVAAPSRAWWWLALSCAGLAPWTKEMGVVAIPILGWLWWRAGARRAAVTLVLASGFMAALYPLYGWLLAGDLFWQVVNLQGHKDVSWATPYSLLRGKVISAELPMGDSLMAWLWFSAVFPKERRERSLQAAAGLYLALLAMLVAGGQVYGWYRLPFYPLLVVMGGLFLREQWREPDLLRGMIFSGATHFMLLYQLRLGGLEATWPVIRLCVLLLVLGLLPATLFPGGWRTRLGRVTVGLQLVTLIILGILAVLNQVEIS